MNAVQHMHDRGIVHNDLKPENLLLTTDSEDACLKVTDFGESYFTDEYFKQMEEKGESVEEEIEMETEAPVETLSDMRQFRTYCSSKITILSLTHTARKSPDTTLNHRYETSSFPWWWYTVRDILYSSHSLSLSFISI